MLGQGAFGEVWLCSLQTGLFSSIDVAVKVSASDESQKAEESEKLFMVRNELKIVSFFDFYNLAFIPFN